MSHPFVNDLKDAPIYSWCKVIEHKILQGSCGCWIGDGRTLGEGISVINCPSSCTKTEVCSCQGGYGGCPLITNALAKKSGVCSLILVMASRWVSFHRTFVHMGSHSSSFISFLYTGIMCPCYFVLCRKACREKDFWVELVEIWWDGLMYHLILLALF
jgi:hypothetical protein